MEGVDRMCSCKALCRRVGFPALRMTAPSLTWQARRQKCRAKKLLYGLLLLDMPLIVHAALKIV